MIQNVCSVTQTSVEDDFCFLCLPGPSNPLHWWPGGEVSTLKAEEAGIDPCFPWGIHFRDFNIGTQVASLRAAWYYRVSTMAGWPCVGILWVGEMATLSCNFSLSVAAHAADWAYTYLRYTCMLLGCWATPKKHPLTVHPSRTELNCFTNYFDILWFCFPFVTVPDLLEASTQ